MKERTNNSKKFTILDFAVDEVEALFDDKDIGGEMKSKIKKLIHFDNSRGFIVPGILGKVIQIHDQNFNFIFLPRDVKIKKYMTVRQTSNFSYLESKNSTHEMRFKVCYRKENYFGKIFYFLELQLASKKEVKNEKPGDLLLSQLKEFSNKNKILCKKGSGVDMEGKMAFYQENKIHSSKDFEVEFFKSLHIQNSSKEIQESKIFLNFFSYDECIRK